MVKRERKNKIGKMEKKRSDTDQSKKPKRSTRKYVLAIAVIGAIAIAIVVLYLLFPELFDWIKI